MRELIEEITTRFGEPMPDAVYLGAQANAWVLEHGGFLSFGRRRVMCLGLQLLATMSVAEFRGILAHECAHFYAGDTRLGPWVYAARSAVLRVLAGLDSGSRTAGVMRRFAIGHFLHVPVTLILTQYWKLFLRCAQYLSRLQEYRSDELAASITGPDAMLSGLEKVSRANMLVHAFWQGVMNPPLAAGCLPPVGASFHEFATSPQIEEATAAAFRVLLQSSKADPYATHPPLQMRLARFERLRGEQSQNEGSECALLLLDDLPQCEWQLIACICDGVDLAALQRLDWSEIGPAVYLPLWSASIAAQGNFLWGCTMAEIPELLANAASLAENMRDPPGALSTREQRVARVRDLIWKSVAVRLAANGWQLHVRPGSVRLVNGDGDIAPQELIERLAREQTGATRWREFCAEGGFLEAEICLHRQVFSDPAPRCVVERTENPRHEAIPGVSACRTFWGYRKCSLPVAGRGHACHRRFVWVRFHRPASAWLQFRKSPPAHSRARRENSNLRRRALRRHNRDRL